MSDERIAAIAMLPDRNVSRLGETLEQLWPVDRTTAFSSLLQAIDQADELRRAQSTKSNDEE